MDKEWKHLIKFSRSAMGIGNEVSENEASMELCQPGCMWVQQYRKKTVELLFRPKMTWCTIRNYLFIY